jgi:hypothetical protein
MKSPQTPRPGGVAPSHPGALDHGLGEELMKILGLLARLCSNGS